MLAASDTTSGQPVGDPEGLKFVLQENDFTPGTFPRPSISWCSVADSDHDHGDASSSHSVKSWMAGLAPRVLLGWDGISSDDECISDVDSISDGHGTVLSEAGHGKGPDECSVVSNDPSFSVVSVGGTDTSDTDFGDAGLVLQVVHCRCTFHVDRSASNSLYSEACCCTERDVQNQVHMHSSGWIVNHNFAKVLGFVAVVWTVCHRVLELGKEWNTLSPVFEVAIHFHGHMQTKCYLAFSSMFELCSAVQLSYRALYWATCS